MLCYIKHNLFTHTFIYRIGEDGAWNEKSSIITNSSRATFHIEALQPFTVYSFRVIAINSIGKSKPSKPSYYIVTLREGMFHKSYY